MINYRQLFVLFVVSVGAIYVWAVNKRRHEARAINIHVDDDDDDDSKSAASSAATITIVRGPSDAHFRHLRGHHSARLGSSLGYTIKK